ncbi:PAS domain S-box-containing protein [Haloplanus vescus]|uniref:histidine kinase n=1 Tax=Haloplanus vescus TaxID=555874 RepID=A0A1H3VUT8_9EURY|nr:DUF5518 domain-containing protein [Haloplanus vescus]SDZ78451.1 PAS domain S-box-containing protein [Haloplanus vescus]
MVSVATLALDALACLLLGWATREAFRSREQPCAGSFIALLATLTLWAAFSLASRLPGLGDVHLLSSGLELAQFGAALALPGLWTMYVLGYTGRGTGLTWRRVVMLAGMVLPVVGTGVVIAVATSEATVQRAIAPLIGWEILYVFVLFVYATYLLADLGGSHARVSNTQVGVLTLGVAAPYLLSLLGNNTEFSGSTSAGLLLSGGLLAVAVRRYPVMTGFPKADYVARTRVVETLQEALVVLDSDDHVLDVNERTTDLFGQSAETIIGAPIGSIVDALDGLDLPVGATGTVALQTSKGRRQFQFSVSAVDEAMDDATPVARTVLLRDVTDRRTREQRLAVLNRILRHNVRNDLDVVLAYADHVDDEELRTGIRSSTTDLLELSTKVRDAEAVMTESTETPEPVDVVDVARDVADQFRPDYDAADISLRAPDEVVLSTRRPVVRRILVELVENALVHTDRDSPHVEIGVRTTADGAVELSVADDGPGLPERVREILDAGTETQLEHGRGIGLWFVNWAVTQLGGDLMFEENDPRGSVVTVRLRHGGVAGRGVESELSAPKHDSRIFTGGGGRSSMVRIGPLQMSETWRYALLGGLLALPVTVFETLQSADDISLGMVVVGSAIAGYLIKRRGGNSTATGLRAALIGGIPVLWTFHELVWAIPTTPNPTLFKAVGVVMLLSVTGFLLLVLATCGALSGRFGGWLAELRGDDGTADTHRRAS